MTTRPTSRSRRCSPGPSSWPRSRSKPKGRKTQAPSLSLFEWAVEREREAEPVGEGRVHRYKGHAVRRNIATTLASDLFADGLAAGDDPWSQLFATAESTRPAADGEMVPYWVFHKGPARIQRYVPVMPFSRDAATLPRLRKSLAAYRLAFGQPRQDELVEFLGADRSDDDLLQLASQLRIDLSPPGSDHTPAQVAAPSVRRLAQS